MNTKTESIAIVGMGCRFPGGANDLQSFWQILNSGENAISTIPEDRFNIDDLYNPDRDSSEGIYTRHGGFVDQPVTDFDAGFFNISPREAEWMDPQQRLALEVVIEALENSGIPPMNLKGSLTGVFIGASNNDYDRMITRCNKAGVSSPYWTTGNMYSIIAGRISYFLGLEGPSFIVDTACSSSLVSIHQACLSLAVGESDMALAGGVNLILSPEVMINFCRANVLSADGLCKTFDDAADGFVRSEGCGIVVLKRLTDALRDKNEILAVISASGVSQDGMSTGLTVPRAEAQEKVIASVLKKADLKPADIDYIEAHGTGTEVGDPIEASVITKIFKGRPKKEPLFVSSVKTVIGHLEAAAGVAGLIKTVLSLKHEKIPPHLNLNKLNSKIDFDKIPAIVPETAVAWKKKEKKKRRAGITAFGMSGTNAHLVLEEAPEPAEPNESKLEDRPCHILALSAKTENALETLKDSYKKYIESNESSRLSDICYSANTGRTHFEKRKAFVARDLKDLKSALSKKSIDTTIIPAHDFSTNGPRVAFLYSGQGSIYSKMGEAFYRSDSTFKSAIDYCGQFLVDQSEKYSLAWALYENTKLLDDPVYGQVGLFAFEYATSEMLKNFGIVPEFVIGHSLGEYAAAVTAGVLDLDSALSLVLKRARLLKDLSADGAMVALEASEDEALKLIKPFASLEIAAVNSPLQTVVSGLDSDCEKLVERCSDEKITVRKLSVDFAFHSSLLEPVLPELVSEANSIKYSPPQIEWLSTVTGASVGEQSIEGSYWANNTRNKVRFMEALQKAIESGCNMFFEVGPNPQLLGLASQCAHQGMLYLPCSREGKESWSTLFESIQRGYQSGLNLDWQNLDKDHSRNLLSLPTYPFQKRRHWLNFLDGNTESKEQSDYPHDIINRKLTIAGSEKFGFEGSIDLDSDKHSYLSDHALSGRVIFPGAGYMELICAAYSFYNSTEKISIESMELQRASLLDKKLGQSKFQVLFSPHTESAQKAEVFCAESANASFNLNAFCNVSTHQSKPETKIPVEEIDKRCVERLDSQKFYGRMQTRGHQFGPCFQTVKNLRRTRLAENGSCIRQEALGDVEVTGGNLESRKYLCHPALLDGCLQMAALLVVPESDLESLHLPISIGKFVIYKALPNSVSVYATSEPAKNDINSNSGISVVDLTLFDPVSGEIYAEIEDLTLKPVTIEKFIETLDKTSPINELFFGVKWKRDKFYNRISEQNNAALPKLNEENHDKAIASVLNDSELKQMLVDYSSLIEENERLGLIYIAKALADLKFSQRATGAKNLNDILDRLNIADSQRKLVTRCLKYLIEKEYIENDGESWHLTNLPSFDNLEEHYQSLLEIYPTFRVNLDLYNNCGSNLAKVWTGTEDPLNLMFSPERGTTLEDFYYKTPISVLFNRIFKESFRAILDTIPEDRTLRILEVGAGTGSSTSSILPLLSPSRTEYHYTDVTRIFLEQASKKFNDYPFIKYEILDLEKDAKRQGFMPGQFDIVIASNVLHATRDLSYTVSNIRQLLAPGGHLLLIEGILQNLRVDLTFGLLKGWWQFEDHELRPDYALLTVPGWRKLLKGNGFESTKFVIPPGDEQAVIVSQLDNSDFEYVSINQPETSSWIIYGDHEGIADRIAKNLKSMSESVLLLNQENDRKLSATEIYNKIKDKKIAGVIHCGALNAGDIPRGNTTESVSQVQENICGSTLVLLQTLQNVDPGDGAGLFVLTKGAFAISDSAPVSVLQSSISGMIRSLVVEQPDFKCRQVDFDLESDRVLDVELLMQEVYNSDKEDQIAFRNGVRYIPRLLPVGKEDTDEFELPASDYKLTPGKAGLEVSKTEHQQVSSGQVVVQVHASGVNFKDVLISTGILPNQTEQKIGYEYSGTVIEKAGDVTEFNVGDAVIGVSKGDSFTDKIVSDRELLLKKPAHLSFCQAASLPLAFITAYASLIEIARLQPGDKIFIPSGAGGVGQAAINIARHKGAKIFATASSERKRSYLRRTGVDHVFNSRDTDFVEQILSITGGEGVDVVLNSLPGKFIEAGLEVLKADGHFIEIGKRGIWQEEDVALSFPEIKYTILPLDEILMKDRDKTRGYLDKLSHWYCEKNFPVPPLTAFPIKNAPKAFKFIKNARHIGKVVLTTEVQPNPEFVSHATYVIAGGAGGLGLEVTRWLVEHGAENLVLLNRSEPGSEVLKIIDGLKSKGAFIQTLRVDIGDKNSLKESLNKVRQTMPPIKGVFHSAGVLSDATLPNQNWQKFEQVFRPKVYGGWNLHELTLEDQLDHFVVFSSAAGLIGSPAQSNHSAANAFLDGLAKYRHAEGLPALSIDWGAWSSVGQAAYYEQTDSLPVKFRYFTPETGIQALEAIMQDREIQQIGVIAVEWNRLFNAREFDQAYLSELKQMYIDRDTNIFERQKLRNVLDDIIRLDNDEERLSMICDLIESQVRAVLNWSEEDPFDSSKEFFEIGMDSLMAVELSNQLQICLGDQVKITSPLIYKYPNVNALGRYLLSKIRKLEKSELEKTVPV